MYTYTDPVLQLKDISLSFGDKKILKDINYTVRDVVRTDSTGQVITLLGPSGIGKSQLMKIIAGLQKPTTGEVLVGKELKQVKPGDVGMVLQNYPLFGHRTVMSNLQLVCKDKEKINHLAEEFMILDHLNKYPCQLSGGQRQRAAIVQQILCSGKFILFDEPFSGLDPLAIEKLCQNIQRVAHLDSENTVIISSHILEPAIAISDSVVMLRKQEDGVATICITVDLIAEGLAWDANVRKKPKFAEVCEFLRKSF